MDTNFLDCIIRRFVKEHGIPYHLGIMLYGPAGTGKSTIAMALANYVGDIITAVDPTYLDKLSTADMLRANPCVVLVEDIDCTNITHDRTKQQQDSLLTIEPTVNLATILNAIDGVGAFTATVYHVYKHEIQPMFPAKLHKERPMTPEELFKSELGEDYLVVASSDDDQNQCDLRKGTTAMENGEKTLEEMNSALDQLIKDQDWIVRIGVVKQGYGLDRLINDPSWLVRRAVAELGYGLDQLVKDPDYRVHEAAALSLENNQSN